MFNELFEKHRDKLKEDRLLVVQGKVQRDDFIGGLRVTADDLLDLAALRARFGGAPAHRDERRHGQGARSRSA